MTSTRSKTAVAPRTKVSRGPSALAEVQRPSSVSRQPVAGAAAVVSDTAAEPTTVPATSAGPAVVAPQTRTVSRQGAESEPAIAPSQSVTVKGETGDLTTASEQPEVVSVAAANTDHSAPIEWSQQKEDSVEYPAQQEVVVSSRTPATPFASPEDVKLTVSLEEDTQALISEQTKATEDTVTASSNAEGASIGDETAEDVRAVAIAAVADPAEFTVSTVVTGISGAEEVEATDAVVELDTAEKIAVEQVAATAPASQPLAFEVETEVEKTSGVENIPEEMAPETVSAEEPSTESIGSEETSAESVSPEEESVDSTGSGATAAAPAGSEEVSGEAKMQPTGEQKEFTVFTSVGEQAETRGGGGSSDRCISHSRGGGYSGSGSRSGTSRGSNR